MAFGHFHRHGRKYLFVALISILVSLLTFPITGALESFAASTFGSSGGAYLVFKTSTGEETGVSAQEWAEVDAQLLGARNIFWGATQFDPYPGLQGNDATLAHFILLAEAARMGIEMPPERAESLIEQYKQFWQMRVSMQEPGAQLTVSDWRQMLQRFRLTEESLRKRLLELLKTEAYVRAVQGVHVVDPERMMQLFAADAVKVGLDYVEFPYDKYEEELRANPPSDADLEAWFAARPAEVIAEKYTRDPRYSIDLVLVDADAWDPASVPAEAMPEVTEPTDEEILNDVKRDPKRYADGGTAPASIEELTDEQRAKVKKDRRLKAVFERLRRDFDTAVAALPSIATEPPTLPDGSPDPEGAAKQAAELAERAAKEKELFAETARKFGFEVTTFEDQEQKKLAELDPPKDLALQFSAPGLAPPGKPGLRTQQAMAARDRKWAYVVRVAAEPKQKEPMPFAEVKEQVLEQWIEEHAKERALEKARELHAALLAEAEKALPADVVAAFQADRDASIRRGETRASEALRGDGEELDEEQKKAIREASEQAYWDRVQAASGRIPGERFAAIAQSLGLEVKSAAPQRRSVRTTDYFNDRFPPAERFLFRQSAGMTGQPVLLGLAQGTVSDVLVDDAGNAAYVAKVASRELPTAADLTPKDRKEFEEEEAYDARRFGNLAPYDNPFAIDQLVARHEPRFKVMKAQGPPIGYGYGY